MKIARLMTTMACLVIAPGLPSCMAHGPAQNIGIDTHPNFVPYDKAFYDTLLSGRAWIFEGVYHPNYRNIVRGIAFAKDGSRIDCLAFKKTNGDPIWIAHRDVKWEVLQRAKLIGAVVRNSYVDGRKPRHLPLYYDPSTGVLAGEVVRHGNSGRQYWIRSSKGHVQDTWPRALANACPGLVDELPAGMAINEKQTSLVMAELRRQDPNAPIRNFPGSQHRAPGTTGLGASRSAPTTTQEEVEAYLLAQSGNVLKSPAGRGYVYARYGGQEELWQLGDEGLLETYSEVGRSPDDTRVTVRIGDRGQTYMVGYPFPLAPTGHRHPAWQITDWLIGSGRVLEVPRLGATWKGVRFLGDNRAEALPASGGAPVEAAWRWTQGQLQVVVRGASASAGHWRELADRLGMGVQVWTTATPNAGT